MNNSILAKQLKFCFFLIPFFVGTACSAPAQKERHAENEVLLDSYSNIHFLFPQSGYAYNNQANLIAECLVAVQQNCSLIGLTSFNDSVTVRFLSSRAEMKQYTGTTAAGIALPHLKTVFIVAGGDSQEIKPPIKHEMMHMIAMLTWGDPHPQSHWMNEGLAALAAGTCNGFTPAQIYSFLLERNMLLPIESLTASFYRQPEMISYHQAAFIVQWLLENYGVKKFKDLWQEGFASFRDVYGVDFQTVYDKVKDPYRKLNPTVPTIDWPVFEKGCF